MSSDLITAIMGSLVGIIGGMLISIGIATHTWKTSAIEHDCAQYNTQTGDFEWNESDK